VRRGRASAPGEGLPSPQRSCQRPDTPADEGLDRGWPRAKKDRVSSLTPSPLPKGEGLCAPFGLGLSRQIPLPEGEGLQIGILAQSHSLGTRGAEDADGCGWTRKKPPAPPQQGTHPRPSVCSASSALNNIRTGPSPRRSDAMPRLLCRDAAHGGDGEGCGGSAPSAGRWSSSVEYRRPVAKGALWCLAPSAGRWSVCPCSDAVASEQVGDCDKVGRPGSTPIGIRVIRVESLPSRLSAEPA
jgi:hypothetical protein